MVLSSVCVEAICRAFTIPSGPLVLEGLFLGYNDLQEGFEGLWNTWLGAGRGISGSREGRSGVCRASLAPYKVSFSLPNPLISPVTTQQ